MDNFRIYDTMFRFNNETERPSGVWRRNQKFVHDAYFWKILNMLKGEGFDVHHDERVSKIIRRNYIEGIRRNLKFKASGSRPASKLFFTRMLFTKTHTVVFTILTSGKKCRT